MMPKKVDDCVKALIEKGYEEEQAWAICQSQFADGIQRLQFADRVEFSAQDKTAISVRDGVLEYMGSEIGMEPEDKVFTVYRSPATIGNACYSMVGIPLTDEHVSLDGVPPDTGSSVIESRMIDIKDGMDGAKIGVQNKLMVSDAMIETLNRKRQLSLGYSADLVPHSRYDFEQLNIEPHHLAVVENGRCGPLCCFLDKRPDDKTEIENKEQGKMDVKKMFYDENGEISLEQVVEIATNLPEAIKKVPVDRLSELMAPMMEINSYMKEQGAMPAEEPVEDENPEEDYEDKEDKENFQDSKAFKDAVDKAAEKKARKLADSERKRYAGVMAKAKDFLDADYDFADKSTEQIMRDALATQYGEQDFEDAELPTAFKLLKKPAPDYSRFGDSVMPSSLEKRIEGSLKQ